MKKLIIDRKKWRRGFDDNTYLLSSSGMCCLGFDAISEGFSELDIKEVYEPAHLKIKIKGITKKSIRSIGGLEHTNIAHCLMHANDNMDMAEEKREKKITSLFKKIGREVEFIN